MPPPLSFRSIKIGLGTEPEAAARPAPEDMPFGVGVLGDFSGRGSRGVQSSQAPRPIRVDCDNLEDVMARLGVELNVPLQGERSRLALRFQELDDFRPERLVRQVEPVANLLGLRERLGQPATFAAAAAELRGWTKREAAPAAEPSRGSPATPPAENLLDAVLAATAGQHEVLPAVPGGTDWNEFLRKTVAAHVVPAADPRQVELVAQLDAVIAVLLRAVMHHPAFQALEAAWRGLHFLTRRLETDEALQLYLVDWTRAELTSDLFSADDLASTQTYRLFSPAGDAASARRWAVLAGNYTFGPGRQDAELLGRIAVLARHAGARFVAAANPLLLGCASLAATPDPHDWNLPLEPEDREAWAALHQSPAAASVGLALPRFLLRLPYGKDAAPVEGFEFEELPPGSAHESYLWGNPAVACTCVLAEGLLREGWDLQPEAVRELDGLPLHVYSEDGEARTKPCAEVLLGNRAAARVQEAGLMPLMSVPGSDRIRLPGFRPLTG